MGNFGSNLIGNFTCTLMQNLTGNFVLDFTGNLWTNLTQMKYKIKENKTCFLVNCISGTLRFQKASDFSKKITDGFSGRLYWLFDGFH